MYTAARATQTEEIASAKALGQKHALSVQELTHRAWCLEIGKGMMRVGEGLADDLMMRSL